MHTKLDMQVVRKIVQKMDFGLLKAEHGMVFKAYQEESIERVRPIPLSQMSQANNYHDYLDQRLRRAKGEAERPLPAKAATKRSKFEFNWRVLLYSHMATVGTCTYHQWTILLWLLNHA